MIIKKKPYHNLLLIASILLILIPPALISGPFLPDLFIVLISIIFLFIYSNSKKIILIYFSFFKLFLIFFLYLIFISIISENFSQSIKPSITYIRFGIFSLATGIIGVQRKSLLKQRSLDTKTIETLYMIQSFVSLLFLVFVFRYRSNMCYSPTSPSPTAKAA